MAKPRTKPRKPARNWRAIAERLAGKLPQARLQARVRHWLETEADANEPWAVAVSGGADSVALLLLVWAHFPKTRKRLTVLHYDHAMRQESAGDAAFVRGLAKALGARYAMSRRETKNADASEAELRDARWTFFREQLKALRGRVILCGHQRDDIVETMLMRLARGSGAGGLSAPRPVTSFADGVVALRPLLEIDGAELREALRAAGAAWREDASNGTDDYLRNRIRRQVIPAWQAAVGERDLAAGVARARALLEEDDEALETMAEMRVTKPKRREALERASLARQPKAVWRRVLRNWLEAQNLGGHVSAAAFEEMLTGFMAGDPGQWSTGSDCWVMAKQGALRVRRGKPERRSARTWRPTSLKPETTTELPTGGWLRCQVVKDPQEIINGLKSGRWEAQRHVCLALDKGEAATEWQARPWQAGDRYQPLGAPGRKKLQDMFTDKKIPVAERFVLPVVCNKDGEPVWVPGLPPAENHRIGPRTHRALWLTYEAPEEIM
jgi:tRNA(Ile)-lysidine synthase